ncbi:MAG: type II toxin-antitoxin system RelE/ParE family toxin [Nanoarchaeota archaeon]
MVSVVYDKHFQRTISKIKDQELQKNVKNKIRKIIESPEIGKPLRNVRKGTREIYAGSFRISYTSHKEKNTIEFLAFYHKDGQ